MAFASSGAGGAMSDINVTPLVDVMLVLLIIFMVTMPIQSIPVDVDLPQKTDNPPDNPKEPPDPIKLRIDQSGQVSWNDTPTPITARVVGHPKPIPGFPGIRRSESLRLEIAEHRIRRSPVDASAGRPRQVLQRNSV